MHSSSSIDLGKKQTSLSDDIVKWALTFGRLLIIVVEIIAFLAFIGRFWLDRDIADLNDKIKGEQAIIKSLEDRETEFRNLHERLSTIRAINTTGNEKLKIYNDILAFTPEDITYTTFIINDERLLLEVDITQLPSLTTYIDSLKNYKQIENATIIGVENSTGSNSLSITIQASMKGDAKN